MFAIAALALAILALPAAWLQSANSVAGTWAGPLVTNVDGKPEEVAFVHVVLKQAGNAVTGTAGENADHQFPIKNGKVTSVGEVTTLTFEFIANGVHSSFSLKSFGGLLKGDARIEGEDGHAYAATAELKPVK